MLTRRGVFSAAAGRRPLPPLRSESSPPSDVRVDARMKASYNAPGVCFFVADHSTRMKHGLAQAGGLSYERGVWFATCGLVA
jgi:hypothetical protein